MNRIHKAVFPVAGLGTRFLPATKANPKEMLPIVDKPLIQYAVEEAIAAGITQMIFVTSSSKRAIEDHFDTNYELEARLRESGKNDLLQLTKSILPSHVTCSYVRQPEPKGLGDAVLCAKPIVGNEPFALLLADDLFLAKESPCLVQMVEQFNSQLSSLIAVEHVPKEDISKYGIIDIAENQKNDTWFLRGIVEKPEPNEAPSNFGVAGRYILTAKIFDMLEQTTMGSGGEIQLTDAIQKLIEYEPVIAYQFSGTRFDCGSKLGYLKATISCALNHPELKESFLNYLKTIHEEQ